jgi:hypothetical protein
MIANAHVAAHIARRIADGDWKHGLPRRQQHPRPQPSRRRRLLLLLLL